MPFRFPVPPALREFLYHALYSIPDDRRFDLKNSYRELGRTNSRAKRFVNKASLEQINHILAMLGIQWFTVYFQDSNKTRWATSLFDDFKKGKKNTELSRLVEEKIYITSDREFIKYLGTSADAIASGEYKRSIELAKAGFHLRKWKKDLNSDSAIQDEKDAESMIFLCKLMNAAFATKHQFEVSDNDAEILLYLYSFQNKYITTKKVDEYFLGIYKSNKITYSLRRLTEQYLIQKHFDNSKKEYQITALGIAMVNKMLGGILKNINF